MTYTDKEKKRIDRYLKRGELLVQKGKHSDAYWLVQDREMFVKALIAMVQMQQNWGFYLEGPELDAALSGDVTALLDWCEERGDAEYEGWDIESLEKV
jgi:hypothetical protein